MPRPRLALPPDLQGTAFTLAAGRAAGLSEWQLFRGTLRSPTHGVRASGPAPGIDDVAARCRELLPCLPPGALFSHATALTLLGIDHPAGLDRPDSLHVEVPGGRDRLRRAGVVGHRRAATGGPVLLPGGIPVAPPERVWCQVAATSDRDELVVLADALTRRRRPCTTVAALARAVARLPPGTRGLRRLRTALPLVRPRTDSCQETRLRLRIVAGGLPCPEVNVPVLDASGAFVALPDLSYRDSRVAIEYDGDLHRTDRATWRRDVARRRALEAQGWRVLPCTADDVRDPRPLLALLSPVLDRTP